MTSSLPGFDDRLNRVLEECAHDAGGDVDTYVARAAVSQMVTDQRRAGSPSVVELLAYISESGLFPETVMPSVSAVITDPDRLRALYATGLLDSAPEENYDRITRAAVGALDAPFAGVTLIDVDRQFFKSAVGIGASHMRERQTPLEQSVCQYTVANGATLILEDARSHPIFKSHPAVRAGKVVAYLGVPLIDDRRNAIGTLCVFDTKPRLWSSGHVQILDDLAEITTQRMFGSGPDQHLQ